MKDKGIWKHWPVCQWLVWTYDCALLTGYHSVAKKSGVKSNIKPPPPGATLQLDTHNFKEIALVNPRSSTTYPLLIIRHVG